MNYDLCDLLNRKMENANGHLAEFPKNLFINFKIQLMNLLNIFAQKTIFKLQKTKIAIMNALLFGFIEMAKYLIKQMILINPQDE